MKLFLTSGGLTTPDLRKEFVSFVGKKPEDIKVAYFITANNPEKDKSFMEKDIAYFTTADITDLSLLDLETESEKQIMHTITESDVIWFYGGNTYYLLNQIKKRNAAVYLEKFVRQEGKIFAGESAGSMIATPSIETSTIKPAVENTVGLTDLTALNFVPFELSPHCPGRVSEESTRAYAEASDNMVIAIDDNSALKIVNDAISPVGNGVLFL